MTVAQLEDGEAEYLAELIRNPPLCTTCLDQGIETQAHPRHYKTYMYCVKHHPAIQAAKRRKQISKAK